MVFINIEKLYDRVCRYLLWWILENKYVSTHYIDVIKYIFGNVVISIRIIKVCLY